MHQPHQVAATEEELLVVENTDLRRWRGQTTNIPQEFQSFVRTNDESTIFGEVGTAWLERLTENPFRRGLNDIRSVNECHRLSRLGYPYSQVRDFFPEIFEDLENLTAQAEQQQHGVDRINEPTMQDQPVEQPVQVEHYTPVRDQPNPPIEEQGEDVLIDIPVDI